RFNLLGNREESTHPEEEGQRHVFNENRANDQRNKVFHLSGLLLRHRHFGIWRNGELLLFHLSRLPGTDTPDDQTDQEEGARRQQQQAVGDIPATVVHGAQDFQPEQFARTEQFTDDRQTDQDK